jgi:hypothetical protein
VRGSMGLTFHGGGCVVRDDPVGPFPDERQFPFPAGRVKGGAAIVFPSERREEEKELLARQRVPFTRPGAFPGTYRKWNNGRRGEREEGMGVEGCLLPRGHEMGVTIEEGVGGPRGF